MKFKMMLVLLALAMPTLVNAFGLGEIELQSGLNQPFKARVKLLSATANELGSLKISLADQEAFDRAGIQRTFLLTRLRFTVQEFEEGHDYIQIRSSDSIREPFLNFLLEINWSKGRLFKEYTVLLDPPTYIGPASKKAVVHPKSPVAEIDSDDHDSDDHQVAYDLDYTPSTTEPARATSGYESAAHESPAVIGYSAGGDYGPVVSGETLWPIANSARPDSSISGIYVEQMMLAILRTNPESFIENNINGLKRGAILQMPDASEINSLNQADALAQVKGQHALWDEYKGHVASGVTERAEGTSISGQAIESEDVEVTDEAELRLISESDQGFGSDQGSAESSGANIDILNDELALAKESVETLALENVEIRGRLTETEETVDDLKRLIVLKEAELAAMQEQIMIAASEQEGVREAGTETVIEDNIEEGLVEEVIPTNGEGIGELFGLMGLVEKAKANLITITGVIGGLLAFVLLILFVSKRRGEKTTVIDLLAEDLDDVAGDYNSFGTPEESGSEESNPEAVVEPKKDTMEEVNVFLTYEHFDVAESFVRNALKKEPDNLDFHSKLLEVFYTAGNKKSYEEAAKLLHEKTGGHGEIWDMVTVMWREMSPNRALFEIPVEGEDEEASADSSGGVVLNITDNSDSSATNDMDFNLKEEASVSAGDMLDFYSSDKATSSEAQIDESKTDDPSEFDISLGDTSGDDTALLDSSVNIEDKGDDLLDVTSAIDFESEGEDDLTGDSAGPDSDLGTDGSDAASFVDLELDTPDLEIGADTGTGADNISVDLDATLAMPTMASQLDLAKAYIELGDYEDAKTILDEIISQGSDDYRKQAEELIGQIN